MSEIKLDINLNDLFHLTYDFDNLKSALGQILKALQFNTRTVTEMKKTVDGQNKEIKEYIFQFMKLHIAYVNKLMKGMQLLEVGHFPIH